MIFTHQHLLTSIPGLNTFLIFVPISFAVQHAQVTRVVKFIGTVLFYHFDSPPPRFICALVSFIAIMPLSKILDFGGEQLAMYCGKSIGDLIIITLNKFVMDVLGVYPLLIRSLSNSAVETVLAIVLLAKCQ